MKSKKISGTFDILHRRYIGENTERQVSLEVERVNAEVARTIYELRKKAGLTQKELAQMVGTTQSVISRLEDADYEGHSLSMLHRIAMALNRRLSVEMIEPINDRGANVHKELPVPGSDRIIFIVLWLRFRALFGVHDKRIASQPCRKSRHRVFCVYI